MVTTTCAHIVVARGTRASVDGVKRAVFLFFVLAGASRALLACGERCQINDPRAECNAYGAPDKYKDAGFVRPDDAAATD